ncbi:glycine cleavage system H protein [Lodderomyces elongisporus NRRL YB-4239]|uniref:Glycine cleavage system H protein n=1 Tax=Lodderomyces elongisporus (strain ATCC 11503 / CBS 2605 / JCM 1781 / NBRC 1676 / NRRL YB-4239) TaxID=379508 RepID=A5E1R4_LODEL|nr:glycine cleavage system H protein [Lodderomyces elongisporus NRRL YB-4239]
MFRQLLRPASASLARSLIRPSVRPSPQTLRCFTTTRFNLAKIDTQSQAYPYLHEQTPVAEKFTEEHEYVKLYEDDSALVGITLYAADALGDVTYVELPELGETVEKGDKIGAVESVKASSEIYSPVSGEVIGVNLNLESEPGLINEDPSVEGWIAQIKVSNREEVLENAELMDKEVYEKSLKE